MKSQKRSKKLLCLGMAALLTFSAMSEMTARAEETVLPEEVAVEETASSTGAVTTEDGWTYEELADGTLEITRYWSEEFEEKLTVPGEIDGKAVTSIGSYAFHECSSLTSIELPGSVTSIGAGAFSGCSGLTSIELPEGVTSIRYSAFSGCSSLTSIELPEGVTSIECDAFEGCSGLTGIELPGSLTSIGMGAFSGCSGLTSIVILGNVTIIWENAFSDCDNLVIKCYKDSYAHQYASAKGIPYELLDEWSCDHASTEVRGQKAATCTQAGYEGDTYCKTCGTLVKAGKSIPAFGHSHTGKVTKEPTLTANGIKTYTCGRCGAKYTEEIPKLAVKYTVKFHGNGSTSGTMKSLTGCGYGNTYTLAANKFKRTGYTFAGWNTKKNGKGKSYKNKAQIKNLTSVDGKTVTLYAQWKKR